MSSSSTPTLDRGKAGSEAAPAAESESLRRPEIPHKWDDWKGSNPVAGLDRLYFLRSLQEETGPMAGQSYDAVIWRRDRARVIILFQGEPPASGRGLDGGSRRRR